MSLGRNGRREEENQNKHSRVFVRLLSQVRFWIQFPFFISLLYCNSIARLHLFITRTFPSLLLRSISQDTLKYSSLIKREKKSKGGGFDSSSQFPSQGFLLAYLRAIVEE